MSPLHICVRLYGELSRYGNVPNHAGKYSTTNLKLAAGSTLKDLLDFLLICTSERGYTFINETLSARPNHQPDLDHAFEDGDQVIFYPLNMVPTALDFDMKITNRMTRTVRADENLNLYYHYE
jgi:hypothetical protein